MSMKSRVLVVEDDPAWQTLLKRNLTADPNIEIDIVDSTEGALEQIKKNKYDLAVVDLRLNEPTGDDRQLVTLADSKIFEPLTVIHARAGIPIIVVTGYEAIARQLIAIINSFPNIIQGWHVKGVTYRSDVLLKNVQLVLDEKQKDKGRWKRIATPKVILAFSLLLLACITVAFFVARLFTDAEAKVFVGVLGALIPSIVTLLVALNKN